MQYFSFRYRFFRVKVGIPLPTATLKRIDKFMVNPPHPQTSLQASHPQFYHGGGGDGGNCPSVPQNTGPKIVTSIINTY